MFDVFNGLNDTAADFGVQVPGSLVTPTQVPTHTGPPAPVANPGLQQDSLAAWVQANPELAGVALLGGAYMAYKAGSLLGGLLAGGAALLYGGQILSGLGANSQPAPIVQENDVLTPDDLSKVADAVEDAGKDAWDAVTDAAEDAWDTTLIQ